MKPTEELMQEHSAIRLMLSILDKACTRLESGENVGPADLQKMLEFLRVFVDGCHHGKEEEHLFPALERAGIPREHGPIGVMLAEHTLGRGYIRGMVASLSQFTTDGKEARVNFAQNARAYIDLLDMHIEKENKILFPMADLRLPQNVQDDLAQSFEKLEVEKIGKGKHEEFHAMLHDLKKSYLN